MFGGAGEGDSDAGVPLTEGDKQAAQRTGTASSFAFLVLINLLVV